MVFCWGHLHLRLYGEDAKLRMQGSESKKMPLQGENAKERYYYCFFAVATSNSRLATSNFRLFYSLSDAFGKSLSISYNLMQVADSPDVCRMLSCFWYACARQCNGAKIDGDTAHNHFPLQKKIIKNSTGSNH